MPTLLQIKRPLHILALSVGVVAFAFANVGGATQPGQEVKDVKMIRNPSLAKGGIGIIIPRELFVSTNSEHNELMFYDGSKYRHWIGAGRQESEVVIVWHNNVVKMNAIPKGFQLGGSAMISFNANEIEFIDLHSGTSGYYLRSTEPDVPEGKNPYGD